MHGALGLVGGELVLDAELGQRRQHVADVIAVEQVGQPGGAPARAASSRARLETLLEPGRLTTPATLEMGSKRNEFIDFLFDLN